MPDPQGLDIALSCLDMDMRDDVAEAAQDLDATRRTATGTDALEARLAALQRRITTDALETKPECQDRMPKVAPRRATISRSWDQVVADAEARLTERGIDPSTVSVDDLLDEQEVRRLEQRFVGGFELQTHLDRYDIMAAVAAGLTAACADFLAVRIPKEIVYLGKLHQQGSPLTSWIKFLEVPADNWLARHFQTSFDKVNGIGEMVDGFGGRTHRLQTFGHDPLVGLVVGTVDIMRGGLTAISRSGEIVHVAGTAAPGYNPLIALVWEIMHLISDGFTATGLPAPGWSLLQFFQAASFGEKERTVAELARFMYMQGYDSRHFLTMTSSVAAAEIVLRGYFTVRQRLDPEYAETIELEQRSAGCTSTGGHPRFQSMALAAHGLAAAANAGKVAIYSGNPLAINYAQWLRFVQALFIHLNARFRKPSDILRRRSEANLEAIAQGWPAWDTEAATFPSLKA